MSTEARLRAMFGYKAPSAAEERACVALRTGFCALGRTLLEAVPPGDAQERALAALQEGLFWALHGAVDKAQAK